MKKNNYYDELKQNIDTLLKEGKLNEVLKLLEEELSMPYVPKDTEDYLKKIYSDISSKLMNEEKSLNINQIFDLLESDVQSIDKYSIAMSLEEYNLSKYLEDIKKLLILDELILSKEIKRLLLTLLVEQDIKEVIEYKEADKSKKIDLNKVVPYKENKDFIDLSSKVQDILFKVPVALDMALNILESTFMDMIFEEKEIDLTHAEYYTALYAFKLLGMQDEYNELLNTVPNVVKDKLAEKE